MTAHLYEQNHKDVLFLLPDEYKWKAAYHDGRIDVRSVGGKVVEMEI